MTRDRGLVIVFTGDGKGKTTAALGIALRAWGHKKRTFLLQFMKGQQRSGEQLLGEAAAFIEVRAFGAGFLKKDDDLLPHRRAADEGWRVAERELASGDADILVLDEISHAVNFGLIPVDKVVRAIRGKREALHVVLTGRGMPGVLIDLADTVTEMKEVRHAYRAGIKTAPGIDY